MVIPAYNEAGRLGESLQKITAFLATQDFTTEVLVVNNNSSDRTQAIAEEYAAEFPYLRVLFEGRQGKGAAVRSGMLAARGEYRFICDADLSMPIDDIVKFLPPKLTDFDVAIGSREATGAVRYDEPFYRHLMGRVFNTIVRLFAVPGFQDTQAGFKMFRGEVAEEIFPLQTMDGWSFDVEVLYAAMRRGYRIVEVPIHWYYMESSRISPLKDSYNMFLEVFKIRLKGARGSYDR
ncbi:MAG: glycosyltransferase family 2 protein [Anaerolineae bacterium]|nr:glycosyltransferase family 2 protein [Anaerolineae bacterium]